MHLLAGDTGRIDAGDAAVDLEQSPGEIIVISSADSELAALASAASLREGDTPSVRLANMMRLGHPMSVDLYVEKTAASARLVVVRMMGGAGYWPYGLESLRALARAGGPDLVVVPGENRWDEALEAYSTLDGETTRRLWRYLAEGGPENAGRALQFMAHLIGRSDAPAEPEVLAGAGFYWPGEGAISGDRAAELVGGERPVAPIVFYRSVIQGASTAPIDALVEALGREGVAALPIFVTSLKDRVSAALVEVAFLAHPPAAVLNTTAFAVSRVGGARGEGGTVLDRPGRPVFQVVLAGSSEEAWRESRRGLGPCDLTMNVVLPEVDGRILTRAISFKAETHDPGTDSRTATYRAVPDRVAFVAKQVANWVRLGAKPAHDRRIALILSRYPNRDGRLASGVGLDTPQSTVAIAAALRLVGYDLPGFPEAGAGLMTLLSAQKNAREADASPRRKPGSNGLLPEWRSEEMDSGFRRNDGDDTNIPLADYLSFFSSLPSAIRDALTERWGAPEADPHCVDGVFRLGLHRFGNVVVGVQPGRGYDIDPKSTYHDPDLVPPHHYLAFYAWLRRDFAADAVIHIGKHGNLEWLPGKTLGLSAECWPEVALGATPLIYPFLVNDPGEGSQAKRRASAVIIDHLMPPMTRAEIHGPLAELETLIDEYYLAAGVDPRRRAILEREIVAAAERHGLDRDLGIRRDDADGALRALDAHLCELKEMQIRDGLHVFGASPVSRQRIDTLVAIARVPRTGGRPADGSLHRAIAADLGLGFDPLDCDPAASWTGSRPSMLAGLSEAPWRSVGDTVERVELLAAELVRDLLAPTVVTAAEAGVHGTGTPDDVAGRWAGHDVVESGFRGNDGRGLGLGLGPASAPVLAWIESELAPAFDRSGTAEIAATIAASQGRFIAPGPSGTPSRGRPDVLPTGRNFYSIDVRAVPTAAAFELGRAAADAVALRYFQDEGSWPRSIALSAWGTTNMRTGGDDIAQVLAFIGVSPVWESGSGRVTGFRILSLAELKRPRIDVTLKISGMFRDAFPAQIDLIDSAIRAVAALDEDASANPIAASLKNFGEPSGRPRIFGAKPGAYGAGMQALLDHGLWHSRSDFAESLLAWGGFAYGGGAEGSDERVLLAERLRDTDAVLHNQDNREHDLLDSDDYYQFHGGLAAAVEALKGVAPRIYHGDHSRPEKPVVRSLSEEIARVVRGRAANPKWIGGMMRHGYKGASEMAATVDFLFAYAALTDAVGDHHFDQLFDAYVADDAVRGFIAAANPAALAEMAARFREAIDRGFWSPRSNSAYGRLSSLIAERKEAAE